MSEEKWTQRGQKLATRIHRLCQDETTGLVSSVFMYLLDNILKSAPTPAAYDTLLGLIEDQVAQWRKDRPQEDKAS